MKQAVYVYGEDLLSVLPSELKWRFLIIHPQSFSYNRAIEGNNRYYFSVAMFKVRATEAQSGYRLDEIRILSRQEIFCSSPPPDRLWGPPSLLSNEYRGSFAGVKAAGT
jgi:hypothetical protein